MAAGRTTYAGLHLVSLSSRRRDVSCGHSL